MWKAKSMFSVPIYKTFLHKYFQFTLFQMTLVFSPCSFQTNSFCGEAVMEGLNINRYFSTKTRFVKYVLWTFLDFLVSFWITRLLCSINYRMQLRRFLSLCSLFLYILKWIIFHRTVRLFMLMTASRKLVSKTKLQVYLKSKWTQSTAITQAVKQTVYVK